MKSEREIYTPAKIEKVDFILNDVISTSGPLGGEGWESNDYIDQNGWT